MDSVSDPVAMKLLDQDLTPSYIPEETRKFLLEKSGPRCAVCGKTLGEFHIDHIKSVASGGKAHLGNLQVLCRTCNLHKNRYELDPRSYQVGYVIPIVVQSENTIATRILDILDDPRY